MPDACAGWLDGLLGCQRHFRARRSWTDALLQARFFHHPGVLGATWCLTLVGPESPVFGPGSSRHAGSSGGRAAHRREPYPWATQQYTNLHQCFYRQLLPRTQSHDILQTGRIVWVFGQGSHATVARRQIAAAGRLRVHALGPRSGGNGAAASRPLAIVLRPPRPPARRPRAAPAHRRPAA